MSKSGETASLEEQINQWRSYLLRRQAVHTVDVAELEDHLREQVADLVKAGLATDEAFLVAVKRMGALDALSREFAREHSERLWKQLVALPSDSREQGAWARSDAFIAFALAVAAGVFIKLPELLFGLTLDLNSNFYARNLSLFVLPLLIGYFAWKRGLGARTLGWLAAAFIAAGVFANVFSFGPGSNTEVLLAIHLPIALWVAVGVAYAGSRWKEVAGRMDFIRFSGELFIYYVLIALGGGVFTGFLVMMFQTIGIDPEWFIQSWLIPCGAAGAVLVASWLVEAKQSVIENMAPVLTRLFTPFFTVLLITFLVTLFLTGRGVDIERELLIAFDLLLVVVLGLLLYSVSARDPRLPPGFFDVMSVVLVVSALLADAVALWAISVRITEFGFTPNRVAALGVNVILLVNLAWSAVLYVRFLRERGSFTDLEQWQTTYLPVYAAWAAIVVIVFPPLFRYI
ncbi:MAG: permease prefix domain 1-containing protein [Bacteroidota bacterium]